MGLVDVPAAWATAHQAFLEVVFEDWRKTGHWPDVGEMQRRRYREGLRDELIDLSREMPPELGRVEHPDRVILNVYALSFCPPAAGLLESLVRAVKLAYGLWEGTPEGPVLSAGDLRDHLGLDEPTIALLDQLLDQEMGLWGGIARPAGAEADWSRPIEDEIRRFRDVQNIGDYLGVRSVRVAAGPMHLRPGSRLLPTGATGDAPRLELSATTQLLGWDQLHSLVAEAARRLWEVGHRRQAVAEAYLAVRDLLKERSELDLEDDEALIGQALSFKEPARVARLEVADLNTKNGRNIQRGVQHLAQGAQAAMRNPFSHHRMEPPENVAAEMLATLSYVARRIAGGKLNKAASAAATEPPRPAKRQGAPSPEVVFALRVVYPKGELVFDRVDVPADSEIDDMDREIRLRLTYDKPGLQPSPTLVRFRKELEPFIPRAIRYLKEIARSDALGLAAVLLRATITNNGTEAIRDSRIELSVPDLATFDYPTRPPAAPDVPSLADDPLAALSETMRVGPATLSDPSHGLAGPAWNSRGRKTALRLTEPLRPGDPTQLPRVWVALEPAYPDAALEVRWKLFKSSGGPLEGVAVLEGKHAHVQWVRPELPTLVRPRWKIEQPSGRYSAWIKEQMDRLRTDREG